MRKRLLSILLLCALLAGSASAAQLPAEDTASPDVLSAGERITGAGIDVSQYQGVIDWDTTAQYIDFAIIRCGRGSDLTAQDDTKWAVNTAACERLGIPYGVYLYSLAQTDEEARSEAAHALRLLDGKHPQLPVYLDLEDSGIRDNCTKAEVLRHATIFCETLQAAGYSVGVYANRYWWTTTLARRLGRRDRLQRQLQHVAKQQQRPHPRHPGECGPRPAVWRVAARGPHA